MILSRSRALGFGALLLGAGGAMQAQAPGTGTNPGDAAPLQESKQALRQLEKDRTERAPTGTGALRGALPQVAAPDLGATALGLPTPPTSARKQRKEAARKGRPERNWLVDGMLGLEGKRPEVLVPGTEAEEQEKADERLESSDPNFLLKAYIKEQQAEEKSARDGARDSDHQNKLADPMAPFLREWLSDSPVEKAALGELAVPSGGRTNSTSVFPGEISPLSISGGEYLSPVGEGILSSSVAIPGGDERAPSNPFLQGLDWGGLPATGGGPMGGPTDPIQPASPPPSAHPAPVYNPLPDMPQSTRSTDRKPPPSSLKENDKFFPQQKKF